MVQVVHGWSNHEAGPRARAGGRKGLWPCALMAPHVVGHREERAPGPLETYLLCLSTLTPTFKTNTCCLASLLSSLRKKRQGKKRKEEESKKGLNQRP